MSASHQLSTDPVGTRSTASLHCRLETGDAVERVQSRVQGAQCANDFGAIAL